MFWTSHTRKKKHELNRNFFPPHVTQLSSVAQSRLTLCDPMDCSTPSFPVCHQLPELAQTHAHRVCDATHHLILCRPLLLPSVFPASGSFPMSQLFAPGGQRIGTSALAEALPLAQLPPCMLVAPQWFSCCFLHRMCNVRYYICVQIGKREIRAFWVKWIHFYLESKIS